MNFELKGRLTHAETFANPREEAAFMLELAAKHIRGIDSLVGRIEYTTDNHELGRASFKIGY